MLMLFHFIVTLNMVLLLFSCELNPTCISGLCGFSMCDGNVTYCCYFLFLFGSDQENDVRDDPGLID
jgi:hypothetical protein